MSGVSPPREWFPTVHQIKYEGPTSKNDLAFRYYNAEEKVLGRTMKDWLRFSVCYWHTWRGYGQDMFGEGAATRPWDGPVDNVESAVRRVDVHFEFLQKLGIDYWCFHDRDIAPEGKTLTESNHNLDQVISYIRQRQQNTGIKVLWGTANLFSNKRFMNGASTNPDAHVFAYAAAQVKKAMDVSHLLGAEDYVFWGGREGYQSLLNTNLKMEQDHMATFLRLAADYKRHIGFHGQLLIEPKPREPTKHQYDFDSATVIGFLKNYQLDKDYKLNIEANHAFLAGHTFEHELATASSHGLLGSIDANTGDTLLGWDVDQFPVDHKMTTLAMKVVIDQGGLAPGGLNFDAKVRRESTDPEDLFIAHINGMDTFARGLRAAAKMKEDDVLDGMVRKRYESYNSGIGAAIHSGKTSFQELEKWALEHGEPKQISAKQELYENIVNRYCF